MEKQYKKAVYIFRRDLRLEDNLGLLEACAASEKVLPIFVFDPRQYKSSKNPYFSEHAFQFMLGSLEELDADLRSRGSRLHCFCEDEAKLLHRLVSEEGVDAFFSCKDYTPFARKREEELEHISKEAGVPLTLTRDIPLSDIEDITTGAGDPYKVFTPFFKNAAQTAVPEPHRNTYRNFSRRSTREGEVALKDMQSGKLLTLAQTPGRNAALSDMAFLPRYPKARNYPGISGTSNLSAHIKFGTISIREVYHRAREQVSTSHQFIAELYWRDFYLHIAYHFPYVFKTSFLAWGERIAWRDDTASLEAWKRGETGVPIVDAGMRELNERGWMHNRARMITASYLSKHLLIDWRNGERYFAEHLIDYDPSSNNGGWQWSASVGADPKPLRIFNPYTQAQKYDPEATYIKQWVPELREVPTELLVSGKEIHFSECAEYPKPRVPHLEAYHRAMEVYKAAKKG